MRNDHLLSAHHPAEEKKASTLATAQLSKDDIHALLLDLVRADRIQDVADLTEHFRTLDDESKTAIRVIAAHSGSLAMLCMLCDDYPVVPTVLTVHMLCIVTIIVKSRMPSFGGKT